MRCLFFLVVVYIYMRMTLMMRECTLWLVGAVLGLAIHVRVNIFCELEPRGWLCAARERPAR